MGAIIGKRYGNDRTKLEKVIPLRTPFLLFVDPSSVCNFRCGFCPCGGAHKEVWSEEKKINVMPYELYRKVIDDMAEFPDKLKTLRLYKEGEPLINRRLPDMIHYARRKNVMNKVDFTTNGYLMEKDMVLALMDAGVDRINISVEALTEEDYAQISGVKIDYVKFLNQLRFLYENRNGCHIFVKISDLGLCGHSEQEFYDKFENVCDEMAVEHVTPVWPDFKLDEQLQLTQVEDIYGGEMKNRKAVQVCPYLFYSLCVNSDGTVSACLMDWNHQLIVGDIKKQSLFEIWNGEKMNELRRDHLLLQKNCHNACKNCGQLEYAVLDNIDEYREKILTYYSNTL